MPQRQTLNVRNLLASQGIQLETATGHTEFLIESFARFITESGVFSGKVTTTDFNGAFVAIARAARRVVAVRSESFMLAK